jgi:hypothetical protein
LVVRDQLLLFSVWRPLFWKFVFLTEIQLGQNVVVLLEHLFWG